MTTLSVCVLNVKQREWNLILVDFGIVLWWMFITDNYSLRGGFIFRYLFAWLLLPIFLSQPKYHDVVFLVLQYYGHNGLFWSKFNDIVCIRSTASDFEFRHSKVLFLFKYMQNYMMAYLDTNLGSIKI